MSRIAGLRKVEIIKDEVMFIFSTVVSAGGGEEARLVVQELE